jgi:enoyl-CoA hydratase/carnithine racemase
VSGPVLRERINPAIEILRLNRPQQRNAMDTALLEALVAAVEQAGEDPDLSVLVFSTSDTRALSAGADVAEPLDHDGAVARMELFTRLYAAVEATPVATVAVCVGNCVGAGAELAAGCDVRVGGDNLEARWVGAVHGVPVGPARLVPLVGLARARELILTARPIDVSEALEIGFVHTARPAELAEQAALEIAAAIAANSREGVRTAKELFREFERTDRRVALENERLLAFQRHGTGLPRR